MWIPKQKCTTHPLSFLLQGEKIADPQAVRAENQRLRRSRYGLQIMCLQTLYSFRWIPKKTLQAQGYYEGARYIWLPKQCKTPSILSPQVQVQMPKTTKVTGQQWKPKALSTTLTKRIATSG